jgi:hypothetical protein
VQKEKEKRNTKSSIPKFTKLQSSLNFFSIFVRVSDLSMFDFMALKIIGTLHPTNFS